MRCSLAGGLSGPVSQGRCRGVTPAAPQPPGRGGGCPPPLPQIRTCAINASGSSGHGLACAVLPGGVTGTRYRALCPGRGARRRTRVPAPPSLHGVPAQRFPRFRGTMRHSDSLTAVSANSLGGVAGRYPPRACLRLSHSARRRPGARGFTVRQPPDRALSRRSRRASQVPGRPWCAYAVF